MDIAFKVKRLNYASKEREVLEGTVEVNGFEGVKEAPADYITEAVTRIGTENVAKLLHRGIREAYREEIARLLKGKRGGRNQLELTDLGPALAKFVAGTDMAEVEEEAALRAKAEAKAARLRKELDKLPDDIKDLVLNDLES